MSSGSLSRRAFTSANSLAKALASGPVAAEPASADPPETSGAGGPIGSGSTTGKASCTLAVILFVLHANYFSTTTGFVQVLVLCRIECGQLWFRTGRLSLAASSGHFRKGLAVLVTVQEGPDIRAQNLIPLCRLERWLPCLRLPQRLFARVGIVLRPVRKVGNNIGIAHEPIRSPCPILRIWRVGSQIFSPGGALIQEIVVALEVSPLREVGITGLVECICPIGYIPGG